MVAEAAVGGWRCGGCSHGDWRERDCWRTNFMQHDRNVLRECPDNDIWVRCNKRRWPHWWHLVPSLYIRLFKCFVFTSLSLSRWDPQISGFLSCLLFFLSFFFLLTDPTFLFLFFIIYFVRVRLYGIFTTPWLFNYSTEIDWYLTGRLEKQNVAFEIKYIYIIWVDSTFSPLFIPLFSFSFSLQFAP